MKYLKKGDKIKLFVDTTVKTKFFQAVPFVLRGKVEASLQKLQDQSVISQVQFSPWAAPIVPVVKRDGSVRICGDYKVTINTAIQVKSYPLPRVEKIFAQLFGRKYFSCQMLICSCS